MANWLKDLDVGEISFVDKGASGNDKIRPRVVLFKRAGQPFLDRVLSLFRKSFEEAAKAGDLPANKEAPAMDLAAIMAKLSPEEQAYLQEQLAMKAAPPVPAPEKKPEDEVGKALASLPESVRKKLEADAVETAELRKRTTALEDDAANRVFVEKAAKLSFIPSERTKFASILKSASRTMPKADAEELDRVFASVNEALKKSKLFTEFGASDPGEGSAIGKITAIAKSLREKDPSMSLAKAELIACEQNPDLYAAYKAERSEAR